MRNTEVFVLNVFVIILLLLLNQGCTTTKKITFEAKNLSALNWVELENKRIILVQLKTGKIIEFDDNGGYLDFEKKAILGNTISKGSTWDDMGDFSDNTQVPLEDLSYVQIVETEFDGDKTRKALDGPCQVLQCLNFWGGHGGCK